MMKTRRKWCVILLGLVMALSLAVSALPAAAIDYAVLNVRYTPESTPIENIEIKAYKLADITYVDKNGKYEYKIASAFEGSKIDLSGLEDKRVNYDSTVYNDLLTKFGNYINDNTETIKKEENTVWIAKTVKQTGKDNREESIAQFTALPNGLYLVTTNAAAWFGNTRYTATPFLVNIPYVDGGVMNNYLTATMKFTLYTPPSSTRPTPTPTPTPDDFVDIPEESPPLTEPPIEILPDDVPMDEFPDLPNDPENPGNPDNPYNPDIEIPDEDVPLASLPQTGLLWWPVPVMAAAGAVLVVSGVVLKRKAERDA